MILEFPLVNVTGFNTKIAAEIFADEDGSTHRQTTHYNEETKEVLMNIEAHKDYAQTALLMQRKYYIHINTT